MLAGAGLEGVRVAAAQAIDQLAGGSALILTDTGRRRRFRALAHRSKAGAAATCGQARAPRAGYPVRAMIRHRSSVTTVAALVLALAAGCSSEEPERAGAGRVIARVNGVELTAGDLDRAMDVESVLWLSGGDAGAAVAGPAELRRRSFDMLLADELMRQAALARGIEVAPAEIDAQLAAVRSQLPDDEAFREHLAQAGLTEDRLREEMRRRLLVRRFAEMVTASLTLDEMEARAIWQREPGRFLTDEQVRVAWLLVAAGPEATPAEREAARREAEQALRKARAGTPFAELVREHSDAPAKDGDLGSIGRGRMHPAFDRVVFATPAGEITPVFETPMGFNVVQVIERREPAPRPYEEVASSLLAVMARERRMEALREEAERLRRAATIEVLDPQLAAGDGPAL